MRIVLLVSMMLGICLGSAMAALALDAAPQPTPTSAVIFVE